MNRKVDFFLNESIRITNRIANWNALLYIDYGTQNLNKKTLEKRMYINGCGKRITNCSTLHVKRFHYVNSVMFCHTDLNLPCVTTWFVGNNKIDHFFLMFTVYND